MSELDLRPFDFTARQLPGPLQSYLKRWQVKYQQMVDDQLVDLTARPAETKPVVPKLKEFGELQSGWSNVTYGLIVNIQNFDFSMVLVASKDALLAYALSILGQDELELPDRGLTAAELSLAKMVFEQVVDSYCRTWPEQEPLAFEVVGLDNKMEQSRVFRAEEDLVVLTSETKHTGGSFQVSLLVPKVNLEQILNLKPTVESEASSNTSLKLEALSEVSVTLSTSLKTVAHMSELVSLSAGDVITFDQKIDAPIPVTVNGETVFVGWPGKIGEQQGIKLDSVA